jgi:1-deoxy-D-xylulose-5-phosphate reductoisomerase
VVHQAWEPGEPPARVVNVIDGFWAPARQAATISVLRDNGPVSPVRSLVILGSTGSIGTQAIDVVRRNPDRFRVVGLAAGGRHVDLLAKQALELGVEAVAVTKASVAQDLLLAFYAQAQQRGYAKGEYAVPKVLAGPEAAAQLAAYECDVVLNGITGSIGLAPTLAALEAGRTLALANKESLIVGGPLVKAAAKPGQIVPVDSEHSALAQALRGGAPHEVQRLVLTASGGPFRGKTRSDLAHVTPAQALAHPTWSMGPVITINSATLVNKGLEVIEAHLLFDVPFEQITVVIHPQSVVHSMVEFTDGSTLAQASPPDMRLPIALALGWPDRVPEAAPACDWTKAAAWEFFPVDEQSFPAIRLARQAGSMGGTAPAVYNAANEQSVAEFLAGRLPFLGIVDAVERVLGEHVAATSAEGHGNTLTLDGVLEAESWARARAREIISEERRS